MTKVRVYEIARQVGLESKVVVEKLRDMGFEVKSHASSLEQVQSREIIEKLRAHKAEVVEKRIGARVIRRRKKESILAKGPEVPPPPEKESVGVQKDVQVVATPIIQPPLGEIVFKSPDEVVEKEKQARGIAEKKNKTRIRGKQRDESDFYRAKLIYKPSSIPSLDPQSQAKPVSPQMKADKESSPATGVRMLKVIQAKEGRGHEFMDTSTKQKQRRKKPGFSRFAQEDTREAMLNAFITPYTLRAPHRRQLVHKKTGRKTTITTPKATKRVIKHNGDKILTSELAKNIGIKLSQMNLKLRDLGKDIDIHEDRFLDLETASILAQEFEYEIQNVAFNENELFNTGENAPCDLVLRPPVVTVMGHVDHGKTSILDAIRKTDVIAGEAGGITQHIGAYEVVTHNRTITFIDTPGHEAFTAMRARGANITDIVVLVIAADDGIMPQTIEAINHAKDASVPILVAINKIDLPNSKSDSIRRELTNYDLVPEEWGGETIVTEVSAKNGFGLNTLLENILLQAELMELKANPKKKAHGTVIEANLDHGRGPLASLLVQDGTLRKGDVVVAGTTCGRVRMMYDHAGKKLNQVTSGRPVLIQAFNDVPAAGDSFYAVNSEREAKKIIEHRIIKERVRKAGHTAELSLENFYEHLQGIETPELKIVVKADVHGSAEVVKQALENLSTPKVKVKVINYAVGGISATDVNLASASGALLIGFNVRPDPNAKKLAQKLGQQMRIYNIIYNCIEDIRKAQTGMLPAITKENIIGRAEVRALFVIPKVGTVAGVTVVDGKLVRNAQARLLRDSVEVYTGKITSLKRLKDDMHEVSVGYECGCKLEGFNDVKQDDIIEAFVLEYEPQSL